ncbi:ATP-binding cassette domain-containing protein [Nakamurella flava]|uniref:ATP-binding cassette domain-containing protein n=1 Tax=Nakamurella flava TaxID=2576308 RepID=A0A4U6QJB7_9ACTN|nr:cysteine peptidase family C39 domain-containing protein [Nakamurella flava]TKV60259.1 ATP-binding cassette domain-containing protein [Nakamurella flava]
MTTTAAPTDTADPAPPPRRARVRCPTILQMEAVECGAAALAIVLAHHGRWEPLETLREDVGVSRDGSNARSILRAARAHGLQMRAYRRSVDSVRWAPLPAILFWQLNHFVVLEGWKPGTWYLNDPATGPRQVDDDEFDRSFSGIVLAGVPGPDFVPGGRRPSVARILGRRLRAFRSPLWFVLLACLVLVVPGLAVPGLSRAFVDGYLIGGRSAVVPLVLLGMAGAAVAQILVTWLQQRAVIGLRTVMTTGLYAGQTQRILRLAMRFFTQRAASDVAYRAGLGASVAELLSGPLIAAVLSTAVAVVYLAVVFVISPTLGGLVLLAAVVVAVLLRFTARRQRDLANRQMRDQIDAAVVQSGSLNLIETLKAGGAEDQAILGISAARGRLLAVRQRQDVSLLSLQAVPVAVTSLATVALLSVGALLVMGGSLTLGSLLAVQILMGAVLAPLGALATLGGQFQTLSATVLRLQDVDAAPVDPEIVTELRRTTLGPGDSPSQLGGAVHLRGVAFGYGAHDPPLLDHVEIELRPGARVAVVGASGSGKSTVARLTVGLLQPTSGQVLFDGRPRSAVDRRVLADGVGFVDQDVTLFEASIRDNLTLFDDTVPDEAIARAIRDACLEDVVAARPGGLDAVLGPAGQGLSGGQRQRLEIARALVRDPAVMVLDEATSALDSVTERAIDLALRRRGCTCLIVAHRLSTVRDAEEIVVLDAGRVVERGTHQSLLDRGGAYARLVRA